MKFEISVSFKIDNQFIDDVLTTAFEGGANHWIARDGVKAVKDVKGANYMSQVVSMGGIISIKEEDSDNEPHLLSRELFITGYHRYIKYCVKEDRQFFTDPGNIDASEADMILQFAVFGTVEYS